MLNVAERPSACCTAYMCSFAARSRMRFTSFVRLASSADLGAGAPPLSPTRSPPTPEVACPLDAPRPAAPVLSRRGLLVVRTPNESLVSCISCGEHRASVHIARWPP
jgi:hypothetical protein